MLRGECQALMNTFQEYGVQNVPSLPTPFKIDFIYELFSQNGYFEKVIRVLKPNAVNDCQSRQVRIISSIGYYDKQKNKMNFRVCASAASGIITFNTPLNTFNPILKPLMDSIKYEEISQLQERTANTISIFIENSNNNSIKIPLNKIIGNICNYACCNDNITPLISQNQSKEGVLTYRMEKTKNEKKANLNEADSQLEDEKTITRRGGVFGLISLSKRFGIKLFEILPGLYEFIFGPLDNLLKSGLINSHFFLSLFF